MVTTMPWKTALPRVPYSWRSGLSLGAARFKGSGWTAKADVATAGKAGKRVCPGGRIDLSNDEPPLFLTNEMLRMRQKKR